MTADACRLLLIIFLIDIVCHLAIHHTNSLNWSLLALIDITVLITPLENNTLAKDISIDLSQFSYIRILYQNI